MCGLRRAGAAALFVALALGIGCAGEGDSVDVTGTVSYDGKAIEDGAITFYPTDGKGPTAGSAIKDGKYSATKVPIGMAKVTISGNKVVGKKKVYNTPNSPERPITEEMLRRSTVEKTKAS